MQLKHHGSMVVELTGEAIWIGLPDVTTPAAALIKCIPEQTWKGKRNEHKDSYTHTPWGLQHAPEPVE